MVSAKSGGLKVLLSEHTSGFLRKSESSHFLVPFHPSGGACRGRLPGGAPSAALSQIPMTECSICAYDLGKSW